MANTDQSGFQQTSITVTLAVIETVDRSWQGPYDYVQEVQNVPRGSTLFEIMQQAAQTGNFRFQSKTFVDLGEFITSVMGVEANYDERKEYWLLLDGTTGEKLEVGASSYKPKDGDLMLFQLSIDRPNQSPCA